MSVDLTMLGKSIERLHKEVREVHAEQTSLRAELPPAGRAREPTALACIGGFGAVRSAPLTTAYGLSREHPL